MMSDRVAVHNFDSINIGRRRSDSLETFLIERTSLTFLYWAFFSRKGRPKIIPFYFEKRVIFFIFHVNILRKVKVGKYMSSSDLHFF